MASGCLIEKLRTCNAEIQKTADKTVCGLAKDDLNERMTGITGIYGNLLCCYFFGASHIPQDCFDTFDTFDTLYQANLLNRE